MKRIFRNLAKDAFLWWVEKDLDRYMVLLEKFELKPFVEKTMAEEMLKYEGSIDIWNYVTSFVIRTYSEYNEVPEFKGTIKEEAELVSEMFVDAYLSGVVEQDIESVKWMFPESSFQANIDTQGVIEKAQNEPESIDPATFVKRLDEVFDEINKNYNRKYRKPFTPELKHYIAAIWYVLYSCVNYIKQYKNEYNVNFINDGEQRCLFNFYTLYLHKIAFTGKLKLDSQTSRIFFAAAALHPAQDDYIDSGDVDNKVIQAIYDKIDGKEIQYSNLNHKIKPVFDLIDIIYGAYPTRKNKTLVEIFKQINYWQNESQKQKEGCSLKELLKISFMKGGYAFALYGYLLMGHMNVSEFRRFFGMGAVFQIMDDLHDIKEDLSDGIRTVWTDYITQGEKADPAMCGIANVQRVFEQITPNYKSFRKPVFIRRLDLFGLRFDILKFYLINSEHFSEYIKNAFQGCLPIDIEILLNYRHINSRLYNLKSMDEFEEILMLIKNSYTKKMTKGGKVG